MQITESTFAFPMRQDRKIAKAEACPACLRPRSQCVCGRVQIQSTRLRVVILQHPQEQLKLWNSARLANMILSNSVLRVGLSWPNLRRAAGVDTEPRHWAALYLKSNHPLEKPWQLFNRKEEPLPETPSLAGLILLDGSWKQAHALWWRNPWLLRVNRLALRPLQASQRDQAKPSGLATLESIAWALRYLGEDAAVSESLLRQYQDFIVQPNQG